MAIRLKLLLLLLDVSENCDPGRLRPIIWLSATFDYFFECETIAMAETLRVPYSLDGLDLNSLVEFMV